MENLRPNPKPKNAEVFQTIDLRKRRNWIISNASLIARQEGYQDNDEFRELLEIFILNTVANSSMGDFLISSFNKHMRLNGIRSSRNVISMPVARLAEHSVPKHKTVNSSLAHRLKLNTGLNVRMMKKNGLNNLLSKEISQDELNLQKLNLRISGLHKFLKEALFQEDTFKIVGSSGYIPPILNSDNNFKNYNWKKQSKVLEEIMEDLGEDKILYMRMSNKFLEDILVFGLESDLSRIKSNVGHDFDKSKTEIIQKTLSVVQKKVSESREDFSHFLDSNIFRQAFSIKINSKTGAYVVSNLKLKPAQLRLQWSDLF